MHHSINHYFVLFAVVISFQIHPVVTVNKTRRSNSKGASISSRQIGNVTTELLDGIRPLLSDGKETIGNVVFNVHHFTQFVFDGNQVYVYSPKKNDENIQHPQKWTFFYIPILQPVQSLLPIPWVTVNALEVRIRLALGTSEVEEAARKTIANQFNREIVDKYSKLWVIAPLMLDSLSAYIVTVGSTPVPGVVPFHIDNPNSNVITFRFVCLTREAALIIAAGLLTGNLDIEVSFYFSGMHRVKTNMITLTATHLQAILSATVADGGGTNATYIHRDQSSGFVAKYVTNVKRLIYLEEPNSNLSLLTSGLTEQLTALFQQSKKIFNRSSPENRFIVVGLANAREIRILADTFGQVWRSTDLNPDRITGEMGKLFTFNQSETRKYNNKQNYYSINQRKDSCLPAHTALDVRIRTLFNTVIVNTNQNRPMKITEEYERVGQDAVSEADIAKAASQVGIEGAWHGKRFIPKSFRVVKLAGVVEGLQVAVIGKQLLAEKANGAVIRRVGALNSLSNLANLFGSLDNSSLFASLENTSLLASLTNTNFFPSTDNESSTTLPDNQNLLIGEIKLYAGSAAPPPSWLQCDGSIVSRLAYPRLFAVIGTKYGEGLDLTTFRLPDLRGRLPMGVDIDQTRMTGVMDVGIEGGSAMHTLGIEELPSHVHDQGTLVNSLNGQHSHSVNDPGHTHLGRNTNFAISSSLTNDYGIFHQQATGFRQIQTANMANSFTQISLTVNGSHTHQISGQTGAIGGNAAFSILPPYQTFHYIIYAG